MKYKAHPFAEIFPLRNGPALWDIGKDIKEHGLLESIIIFEEMILDGRGRDACCEKFGVQPVYEYFEGTRLEALNYVRSKNLFRRHLGEGERAMAAADYLKALRGIHKSDKTPNVPIGTPSSQKQAAKDFNVSLRSINRAVAVQDHAEPEVANAVRNGHAAVSDAATISKEKPAVQRKAVEAVVNGHAKTLSEAVKPATPEAKKKSKDMGAAIGKVVRYADELVRGKPRLSALRDSVHAHLQNAMKAVASLEQAAGI